MIDPPLQMPMPRRQFASPTPNITPNITPAASRTTSCSNLISEPPDEIREIFLGQRATPDSLLTEGSGTMQLTRQFSGLSLDSSGLFLYI